MSMKSNPETNIISDNKALTIKCNFYYSLSVRKSDNGGGLHWDSDQYSFILYILVLI